MQIATYYGEYSCIPLEISRISCMLILKIEIDCYNFEG